MNNVLYQHGLMGLTTPGEWVRPVDWLPMPTTVANSVDILAAVFDHDSNYCSVKISTSSGTYNVDWGDGTTSTGVTSNTQADHVYAYSALSGTDSTLGYRQALIRITPATGNISEVNLNVKNARAGLVNGVVSPWLDVVINAPSATTVSFYSTSTANVILQRVKFVAIGAIVSMSNAFSGCTSLQSVVFPAGSLASVTSISYAFSLCYSLKSVVFPAGSLASVILLNGVFYNCVSLQSVVFPAGSLAAATLAANALNGCGALQSVAFPSGSLSAVVDAAGVASGCSSLSKISGLGLPVSIEIPNCRLSGAALNAIFTSLPTVTGKTITVTGNHGVPDCTPSIATAKGWTVIT